MSFRIFFAQMMLFYIIVFFIWITDASGKGCCSTSTPNMLEAFQKNILKRRTRAVIFPKKAQLLLTPAFTKGILGGIPRGLGYTIEFDMYHILPDTVEGWKPNVLINQIEKEKQGQQTEEVIGVTKALSKPHYSDGDTAQNGQYYEPSYLRDHELYQFPFHDIEVDPTSWGFGQSKVDIGQTDFIRNGEKIHNGKRPQRINALVRNFHARPYVRKKPYTQFSSDRSGELRTDLFPDTIKKLPRWYYNQNYRERREIYDQLETAGKIFNINIKACVKRAMCEVAMHLKPYGESLMDDIIRIVLTIPVPKDPYLAYGNDDYSHRYEGVNCAHRFAASCPYRVMEILTQSLNNKMT